MQHLYLQILNWQICNTVAVLWVAAASNSYQSFLTVLACFIFVHEGNRLQRNISIRAVSQIAFFLFPSLVSCAQWQPQGSACLQGEVMEAFTFYSALPFILSNWHPLIICECLFTDIRKCESKKGLGMAAWAEDAPARHRRTRLTVIWHTVKDPRNLHSDCVPVGWAELCLSLAMLALIPKLASALLRELEGAWSESSPWQAAISPSRQHTAAYTWTCLHSEAQRSPLPLCFQGFTSQIGSNLSGFLC